MEEIEMNEGSPIDVVGKSAKNAYFDEIIGHIEDIVLSDEFIALHSEFFENWEIFDDVEENRLEYTDIFLEYVTTFEQFLVEQLHKRMESFDMQQFASELSKETNLTSDYSHDEIFELLHTFNSFQAFKELMLDYRRSKERKSQNIDFDGILITKPIKILEEKWVSVNMKAK